MGFFDDRENLGPPPEPFRSGTGGGEPRSPIPLKWVGIAAAILVLFITANTLKGIYVDYLWFESVGFEDVFSTRITTQVILFLIGAAVAAAIIGGNVWLARRFAPRGPEESFIEDVDPDAIRRIVGVLLVAGVLFMAVIFGSVAGGAWETVLRWMNGVQFGQTDPQFGRDVAFYVFDLPAFQFFHGWFMGLVIVSALGAGAVYGLTFSLQRFELNITRGMRIHLSILGGLVLLLIAVSTYLSIFELVASPGGLVYGGLYTDMNARLPVRYILVALAAFAGIATIANAFLSSSGYRVPLFAFGLWAFAGLVGGVMFPQAVQSFQVDPNEFQREAPYIDRNIAATREAWALREIEAERHPANPLVTADELDENPETLANIRLLDPLPLTATLNELQALRPLYRFADIDISRYPLAEEEIEADQQVLISARELDLGRVADRNWTRDRLQLTHGFGAIATPVTEVGGEGLPVLTLRDIPPRTEHERLELTIDGSRIYFGELTNHYVVVNSHEPEFDFPDPDAPGQDKRNFYEHDRGIPLSSVFRRFLMAWELGDFNLLISGQIHEDSRVLMHRQIQERVREIAPFLVLDSDPYLMVIDGDLKWMQPAYTVADRYPYSEPRAGINYIRNSVQIVIDTSTGDMDFYLIDEDDPIVRTWAGIFPELFTSQDQMPDQVRQQLRYPLDMFRVQAQHYQRYHVTSPEVFFTGEDFWEIPIQRVRGQTRPMEPYYVTMRLPGQDEVEFVLIMPFTPRDRENTVAWLAGRSDGEHFGSMINYRFPSGVLVFGPAQVENRIEQNALISQQLTLWDTAGSEVLRSTLMMIPVGDSFLYVQPVYLQAEGGRMPELRRVIVANGNAVSMEETFEEALEVVMGQRAPTAPEVLNGTLPTDPDAPAVPDDDTPAPTPAPGVPAEDLQELIRQMRLLLDQIEQRLNQQGTGQ